MVQDFLLAMQRFCFSCSTFLNHGFDQRMLAFQRNGRVFQFGQQRRFLHGAWGLVMLASDTDLLLPCGCVGVDRCGRKVLVVFAERKNKDMSIHGQRESLQTTNTTKTRQKPWQHTHHAARVSVCRGH